MVSTPGLVLVEGIPGSGKTTAARLIAHMLRARGDKVAVYLEGDVDHPADYEAVAYLSEAEFASLQAVFPSHSALLLNATTVGQGTDRFVSYGRLCRDHKHDMPEALLAELRQRDVCDGSDLATYCRLAVDRWASFVPSARGMTHVFECCLMQNPTTIMMCRHDADLPVISEHILRIAQTLRELDPVVIYLRQPDVRLTLEHVAAERPQAWLDFVTDYVTGQGWGRRHGLSGFDGVVRYYEVRQEVELKILARLGLEYLILDPPHDDRATALTKRLGS